MFVFCEGKTGFSVSCDSPSSPNVNIVIVGSLWRWGTHARPCCGSTLVCNSSNSLHVFTCQIHQGCKTLLNPARPHQPNIFRLRHFFPVDPSILNILICYTSYNGDIGVPPAPSIHHYYIYHHAILWVMSGLMTAVKYTLMTTTILIISKSKSPPDRNVIIPQESGLLGSRMLLFPISV